jgi:hypothetical protein
MTVTGKHRKQLIELLIYYLNKDKYNTINFANFINEEDPTGRYFIKCYIDEYKERVAYIDEYKEQVFPYNLHPNKKLGIK